MNLFVIKFRSEFLTGKYAVLFKEINLLQQSRILHKGKMNFSFYIHALHISTMQFSKHALYIYITFYQELCIGKFCFN